MLTPSFQVDYNKTFSDMIFFNLVESSVQFNILLELYHLLKTFP
jgi:hypothetical protein